MKTPLGSLLALALEASGSWLDPSPAAADAPTLYHQPNFESPTRADPDDLLVLAGDGLSASDAVVYAAVVPGQIAVHPEKLPEKSTAGSGLADIVSAQSAPLQLTIRMPAALDPGRSYRIWVRTLDDQWSNPVAINDARPLWISPSVVYASQTAASLPRYIKVVGRNLESRGSNPILICLSGPKRYVLDAKLDASTAATVQRYAATLRLPPRMEAGQYRVALSVDGTSWVDVGGAPLTVVPDLHRPREFPISAPAYGACRPNHGDDASACINAAVEAAAAAGGGAVVIGPGTWHVTAGKISLPGGVQLLGLGPQVTRLVRHDGPDPSLAAFTLLGNNQVSGIRFTSDRLYGAADHGHPVLQLGAVYSEDARSSAAAVQDVTISDNVFDKPYIAITDGGSPIERLLVTHNRFGAFHAALELGGNRRNVHNRFQIADSIISHNTFVPGSSIDRQHGQGAVASEIGASTRLDFSDNTADGADREFLNSADDPPGWRAGFFFHMNNSHEMLLISGNFASCTGDKAGDGEAIALDNNANTFGLAAATAVLAATQNSVRIAGPLKSIQNERPVDLSNYYIGHWLHVAEGPGMGQTRRIVSYRMNGAGTDVTFVVSPAWDVIPRGVVSSVTIGREFWQAYVVGNTVDQRKPLCTKANATRPKGGAISIWAQTSDSVVEGNRQFDTDGILFQQAYGADDPDCSECAANTDLQSFLEIRSNLVDGEYDWDSACSLSGIMGSYGAAPTARFTPPPLSVGVSISHNTISRADGLLGGAITVQPTWYRGPEGYKYPLIENLLIHHNHISHVSGGGTHAACGYSAAPRIGIRLGGESSVAATVLYMNACDDVTTSLVDNGINTRRVCDNLPVHSCECNNGR
jgi:hypothetical protein